MNYNELKEITKLKNILVKDLAKEMGITRQGLQKVLDNETIELRKLKKLCEILRISPAQFFDTGTYGVNITTGHVQAGNGNKIVLDSKEREIDLLKQRLNDKEEMIKMLREKIELIENRPHLAATPKSGYDRKK